VAREITDRFRDIPPQRVHVSPPGPNPELLAARPAAVGQLERPFLLMVGTLEPRKNHLTALRAFAEHRGRHPESDALLVLAGSSGWLYQPVTSAIRELGLDQHVVRLGTVDSGTLRWLYEHALALLFPSLYEGFGLPVLEAFALSCPVIASRIPAVIEVAGPKAATLLDPMDVGAWSSWIGRAIARQLDPGQIEAGRRRAQAFTWEGCATAVVGAIRTAIAPA
jgi:glycosyltransferase involved in cell wall biosynthesis